MRKKNHETNDRNVSAETAIYFFISTVVLVTVSRTFVSPTNSYVKEEFF